MITRENLNVISKIKSINVHNKILARVILAMYDYNRKDSNSLLKIIYYNVPKGR